MAPDEDLLPLLAGALQLALEEIHSLNECQRPLPDEVATALHEREALAATLKTLPEQTREELKAVYRKARCETWSELASADWPIAPVLPDVRDELESALQVLTRRCRLSPEIDAALGHAVGRWPVRPRRA